ncbi:MAG: hypothetical protein RL037_1327 [Bacteroidota bacterium]
MNQQIQDYLVVNAINIFGQQIESDLIQLSQTKKELDGDITLVVFPFVKLLKSSPVDVGNKIGTILQKEFEEILRMSKKTNNN